MASRAAVPALFEGVLVAFRRQLHRLDDASCRPALTPECDQAGRGIGGEKRRRQREGKRKAVVLRLNSGRCTEAVSHVFTVGAGRCQTVCRSAAQATDMGFDDGGLRVKMKIPDLLESSAGATEYPTFIAHEIPSRANSFG